MKEHWIEKRMSHKNNLMVVVEEELIEKRVIHKGNLVEEELIVDILGLIVDILGLIVDILERIVDILMLIEWKKETVGVAVH